MRQFLGIVLCFAASATTRAQLSLLVNAETGVVEILNQSTDTYSWNYYEIRSEAGSLNVSGWFSFDDQNFDAMDGPDPGTTRGDSIGEGWDESPNSNANVLAELFLTGSSTAAPNNLYFLGVPFTPNGVRDLDFNFGTTDGSLFDGVVIYSPELPEIDGDFDDDGDLDCGDIDALVAAIVASANDSEFDLNGDGLVNEHDLDQWRSDAGSVNLPSGGAYLEGDANLDGVVDISDFNIWNANKFSINPSWCSADFNASGSIDISDFNIWNANKFQVSDAAVVPEPNAVLFALGFWIFLFHGSRSHTRWG